MSTLHRQVILISFLFAVSSCVDVDDPALVFCVLDVLSLLFCFMLTSSMSEMLFHLLLVSFALSFNDRISVNGTTRLHGKLVYVVTS